MRPLYITEGDPSGISPEIFRKEFPALKKIAKFRPVVFFRSPSKIAYPNFDFALDVDAISKLDAKHKSSSTLSSSQNLYLSDILKSPGIYDACIKIPISSPFTKLNIEIGKPNELTGLSSWICLETSMKWIQKIPGDLITLPLSKEWVIRSGNKKFQGHTEALAKFFGKHTFMLMAGDNWNVIPLTTHIPLKDVSKKLKKVLWQELYESLVASGFFGKNPKIGILGLNPHAGEGGKIGNEESTILMKNLEPLRKQGAKIFGPLSADSTFAFGKKSPYDVILACYHDQGLIPFKMLEGKNGVNITLGLDFLRVSPDHGTAYDIAGKGIADSSSFKKCLEWCHK
ncbi:4-hydroxythreonine-4-phosphate dehydrogenase PdxA [Leptospira sp. GIMC2001]|nr:4-hydroxythreonine-4-phosphate dehydrogenase PdxA [Leptospira sp. GIMC2001]WCL51309.1 4-hydroxythreonine-4-phosphate dehydrogenase PdxA [Leptospira sp. GIMC2001]